MHNPSETKSETTILNLKTFVLIFLALLSILAYSFITETILPVFENKNVAFGITCIVGFLILVSGSALLAYIGFVFSKRTFLLFQENDKLNENILLLRNQETSSETKKRIRKENFKFLIQNWRPTFKYFGLAVLLIIFGAVIVIFSDGTIVY